MCNCLGRNMVLQFPECIFHFPAGNQHSEISQIQGRAYPEESEDGYCWFVIRADRSRLSRVLVEKRMRVEGIRLCYLCERQSVIERISILLFTTFQPSNRESSFAVEKTELNIALRSVFHSTVTQKRPQQARENPVQCKTLF